MFVCSLPLGVTTIVSINISIWSNCGHISDITNAVYRHSERAPKNQCSHNGGKIWENINSALQLAMLQLWCQSLPGRYYCLLYGQGERKKTEAWNSSFLLQKVFMTFSLALISVSSYSWNKITVNTGRKKHRTPNIKKFFP